MAQIYPIFLSILLAATLTLSGCIDSGNQVDQKAQGDIVVIEDPSDYSKSAVNRPHVHNYWAGKTNISVLEQQFTLQYLVPGSQCGQGVDEISQARNCITLVLASGDLIIPGTEGVLVGADWSTSVGDALLNVSVYTPMDHNIPMHQFNLEQGGSRLIRTNDTFNDLPHSTLSGWRFDVSLFGALPGASVEGTVGINILRQDGPLQPVPPHPDYWANTTALPLHESMGELADISGQGNPASSGDIPPYDLSFIEGAIVPPQAASVEIMVYYNSTAPLAAHHNPVLNWHGAESRDYSHELVPPTEVHKANVDGFYRWELDVDSSMWDSPYASASLWELNIQWTGETPFVAPSYGDGDYHVVVEVFNA